ncbi:MAG TPA: flagellar biosynthetic protein FliO [Pseudomonadota bacterium]|nr:flagellar biosynthetic protein FliO [Pseudomonadota bacterium]HNN52701.1 flagellar biosynthetic protein FliO [Pseudomonadota bacterium]HNO69037.1 flagellar biosynthetic protein FliO [Pseudomonadota bacterium]
MLAQLLLAPWVDSWPVLGLLLRATLVLLLLVAVLILVRRTQRGRASGMVTLLEKQQLSSTHAVYLVRVLDRKLLLGGGASGLSLLCDLSCDPASHATKTEDQVDLSPSWMPPVPPKNESSQADGQMP